MNRAQRRSTARKLVASSALVGGALALTFGGAFATFTDTVSAGPQAVSSGVIRIATTPTNDAGTGAAAIVPGDTITREIDLTSSAATANASSITLQLSASPSNLLTTDPTNGLNLSIKSCPTAPTRVAGPPPSYTCAGATTVQIGGSGTPVPVSSLVSAPAALSPLQSLTAGKQDYLLFTLTFPSSAPGDLSQVPTQCSGTSQGTAANENLEGCSTSLTYTFVANQRAAGAQ